MAGMNMEMLPAAQPSWCPACGQPWEAHWRCPPRKRRTGKLAVLAVLVALVLLIESVAFAVFIDGAFVRSNHMSIGVHVIRGHEADGPIAPMLLACRQFNQWKASHEPGLLQEALAAAYSPRVPEGISSRFRGELGGLANWNRVASSLNAPKVERREEAVEKICGPLVARFTGR
jgi:hypothetical protein